MGYPKTSGNRGIHVYVRIEPRWDFVDVRHAAIGLGRELAARDDQVTVAWWKEERGERIFVDYNQNNRDRTIASAYSLRPLPGAPVSTPMTWDELAEVTDPAEHHLFSVPDRLADGDPWATIDDTAYSLEPLLGLWEQHGAVELNYPPDYPKMPGEPPRVQPSKKVAEHWDDGRQPDRVLTVSASQPASPAPDATRPRPARPPALWTGSMSASTVVGARDSSCSPPDVKVAPQRPILPGPARSELCCSDDRNPRGFRVTRVPRHIHTSVVLW